MTKEEKKFFADMKKHVAKSVRTHGTENIKGFRVTEKGIEVKLKSNG